MEQKKKIIGLYRKRDVVSTFDKERRKYLFQRVKHETEANFLKDSIEKIKEKEIRVLDVACGTGRMLPEVFDSKKNIEYYGLDSSIEMTKELKKKAKAMKKRAHITIGDAAKMPFKDGTFDLSYSFHLLWHIEEEEQKKVLKEMIRVTKPGGFIVFDILNKDFIWEKTKGLFGRKKEAGLYKINIKEARRFIRGAGISKLKKLSDAPIKNNLGYRIFNLINKADSLVPQQFYHMIYIMAEKEDVRKKNR